MGRRKQFRPKKAENSNEPEDVVEATQPSPPPPALGPGLLGHPHHMNGGLGGFLAPWLCELKGPEGMAARLLQLQRLALSYNNSSGGALGKIPQMDPLDLSSKLPFPWSLPQQHVVPGGGHTNHHHTPAGGPLWSSPGWPPKSGPRMKDPKDIFRCVWCTESYSTLEELTGHLVEAKHGSGGAASRSSEAASVQQQQKTPLPRKLVRGQDVWLGKGQEQTREILKCMWCGQSFKSLAELTTHMQETKHYTKVISQEQITSWKQQQAQNGGEESSHAGPPSSSIPGSPGPKQFSPPHTPKSNTPGGNISDVLTCKVCEEPCSSLKDLTAHMARNNHYNNKGGGAEAKKRIREASPPAGAKRKKSLPVRKLLELERIKSEPLPTSNGSSSPPVLLKVEENASSGGNSILGSLEAMVETSFKGASSPKKSGGLLSRLGIEEDKGGSHPPTEEELFPRLYPKFLSSFLNNNSLRSLSTSSGEEQQQPPVKKSLCEDRLSSPSSSSSSPLPLRCSLCSDELGDKENFADHFERKHASGLIMGGQPPLSKEIPSSFRSSSSSPGQSNGEESSESKFLKYTELAKQLSGR